MALPDSSYLHRLDAGGGREPYVWALAAESGPLPDGLSLTPEGVIEGIPTDVGVWNFTVSASDQTGSVDVHDFVLIVPPLLDPDQSCADFPPYAVPTFADPALDRLVKASQFPSGPTRPVSCQQLAPVPSLFGSELGIHDLTGIQNLPSLRSLRLDGNSINDIGALAPLSRLEILTLGRNAITDVSPLEGHTGLNFLALDQNPLSDVSALGTLTGLDLLTLDSTDVSDLAPLATPFGGAATLTTLSLTDNGITDIGPLSALPSIEFLYLDRNTISDIGPLAGLSRLEVLGLVGNTVSDLTPLGGLTRIRELRMEGNAVTSLAPLAGVASMYYLRVPRNSIVDLGTMDGLELWELDVAGNQALSDVSALLAGQGLVSGGIRPRIDLQNTAVSCADVRSLRIRATVFSACP